MQQRAETRTAQAMTSGHSTSTSWGPPVPHPQEPGTIRVKCTVQGELRPLGTFQRAPQLPELLQEIRLRFEGRSDLFFSMPHGAMCVPVCDQHDLDLVVRISGDHFGQDQLCLLLDPPTGSSALVRSPIATPERWSLRKLVGQGSFGAVYLCEDRSSGREFSLKVVELEPGPRSEKRANRLEAEIQLLRNIRHQYIVQYFGCRREGNRLCIFMEFMGQGSVKDVLRQFGPVSEGQARRFTRMVLAGLGFLHGHNIVHGDIKCANIMLDSADSVKLADFSASRQLSVINNSSSGSTSSSSSGAQTPANHHQQTVPAVFYTPPEVLEGAYFDCRSDVWSVGATVVEFLTGNPPYHDQDSPRRRILADREVPLSLPETVSGQALVFIRACFTRPPERRPSARSLLGDPFCSY